MRSGRINKIISLQKNESAIDPKSGQKLEEWVEITKAWAGIEPLRGTELYTAQQANSQVTTRVVVRYTPELVAALDHTCSVLFESVRYQLLHDPINPSMSNRELHLMCKVVT